MATAWFEPSSAGSLLQQYSPDGKGARRRAGGLLVIVLVGLTCLLWLVAWARDVSASARTLKPYNLKTTVL